VKRIIVSWHWVIVGVLPSARGGGDGGAPTPSLDAGATSSPDRTMVLYSDGGDLWVAGVDGGDARAVADGAGVRWPPGAWRPLP
jgi:hypothetical protein